ncbi:MAG: undecaprenyldiphospho-muramoylpentapeptide beta-N-acetylglucosaminyltransferase [Desulfovibrio sp.]|nr:undecaprenyldiphospho-muramoylpentapeptide beta-N-acetylglucosaminyltransferase [Desulfovibrio sp.]
MNRVLLTTGGTGGHIFPALAVAEELRRRQSDIALLFVGSHYGPEKRLAGKAGVPFRGLHVRGILGRGARAVGAALHMAVAVSQAVGIIREFRPDVVAGFGGYAAFAPMFAGWLLGVPCVLHEQNAIAGTSNRFLARLSRRVCVSLPQTEGFKASKCVLVGNPVRAAVRELERKTACVDSQHLLVVGGSQGAHSLNAFMVEHLANFRAAGVHLWHQTGEREEAAIREAYTRAGYESTCATAFIDNMAEAYAWADVVLCRAGASTVAELCAAGLPSVLVPFPHAIHDHQTRNAAALERCGAAILVPEQDMEKRELENVLLRLLHDHRERERMGRAALACARPDAASSVVAVLEETVNMGRK